MISVGQWVQSVEKTGETRFVKLCKSIGCKVSKFEDSSEVGAADRIVFTPVGISVFAEWKDVGEVPRADQIRWAVKMANMGFLYVWGSCPDEVFATIKAICQSKNPQKTVNNIIQLQLAALA